MSNKAIIVGAGIGGLATAIRLRVKGYDVEVIEANSHPGGKMSEIDIQGFRFDAGPSLFTLPHEVDALFELADKDPRDYYDYEKLDIITHYFYEDGTQILAYADVDSFAREVQEKTGESALDVKKLLKKSETLYDLTHHVFLERSLHQMGTYLRMDTIKSILQLHKLDAFRSMNVANEATFSDPRIIQLFNRYATYNGSDPYQAPATLNIIPHLEFNMGAYFPKGGIHQIADSVYRLGLDLGIQYRFDTPVEQIMTENGKVKGVKIDNKC